MKLIPWTKPAAPLDTHELRKLDFNRRMTELNVAQFSVDVPPEMREGMTFSGALAPRISRDEALQVPAVLRARNLIAGTLASLPVHFYDTDREQVDSTFLKQIDEDKPNVVTLAETYEDLLFYSESWWRITRFTAEVMPRPLHAVHVPKDSVHVAPAGEMPSMQRSTADISFAPTGTVFIDGVRVPWDQLILFISPNPPLLRHAARAIRTCLRLDRTAANYADVPIPLNIFTPAEGAEELSETEIDDLMDRWFIARQQRIDAYLPAGIEREQVSWNATDIQLHDQRQHAVLEIARATGIDPEDLGVSTTSRTYQNAEQRRLDLLDFTLMPYVQAVEQRLSMNQVSPRGTYAKVNMDGFLRSDTKTRYEAYKLGKEVGAVTDDEIRELEDRPRLTPRERAALQPPLQPVSSNGARPMQEVR